MGSQETQEEDAGFGHPFPVSPLTRSSTGFARRYFTLYQSGILTYAFDRDQPVRDQVSLHHSAISTAPGRKDIHIDSNTTFHIKCLSTEDFDLWMAAFRYENTNDITDCANCIAQEVHRWTRVS
jgi:hypothetical protein